MKGKIKLNEYKNSSIKIGGSKNSSLPIIAASILCNEPVIINNVPNITDIISIISILKDMNYNITFKNNTVKVYPTDIYINHFNNKTISKLRGSYYLIGALIGKYKQSDFSFLYPGGCKFIKRPINYHINAFKKMGLTVLNKKNKIFIKGTKHATIHDLEFPSVGTTINIILASVKTDGITIINNASIEPEVIDFINFLNAMRANITIINRTIKIIGTPYLHSTTYSVMCDRIEATTFLCLGALHNGIKITHVDVTVLKDVSLFFKSIGYKIKENKNSIILTATNNIKPFAITLEPYPGLSTDLGPIFSILASKSYGKSYITDNVYMKRHSHIKQLRKMDVDISNNLNTIIIKGNNRIIKNKTVKAYDLRCAACLMIACSLSHNFSKIKNIEYLLRGYEDISSKLSKLGIDLIIK